MKTKLLILLSIIGMSCCYAIWKNNSMEEIDFETVFNQVKEVNISSSLSVFTDNMMSTVQYDNDLDSLIELYDAADIVAIIQPISRKQEVGVVNTLVEVKECFKSDYQSGQQIFLFEQYHLQYSYHEGKNYTSLFTDAGYIPMDVNKEYFVFLKKSEKYSSDQFGFLSLLYGKFPYLNSDPVILEIDSPINYSGGKYPMNDLGKNDLVFFNLNEEEESPVDENTKNMAVQYEEYKVNYMQMLNDLRVHSYQNKK